MLAEHEEGRASTYSGIILLHSCCTLSCQVHVSKLSVGACRAKCELRALKLGWAMLVERTDDLPTVAAVIKAAKTVPELCHE